MSLFDRTYRGAYRARRLRSTYRAARRGRGSLGRLYGRRGVMRVVARALNRLLPR